MKSPRYTRGFVDRHGKPRFYFRREGFKSVALPGLPWSPEFMAVYEAANSGEWERPAIGARRTLPGTVNAGLVSYYGSAAFRMLAASTQANRRAILELFRNDHGDKRIAPLDQRALRAILDKKKPFAAKSWLKALRGFVTHCIAIGMRSDDPTIGLKLRAPKSDGFHTWTDAEIEQFEARHAIGTKARLALALLYGTGLARADVVRFGRQHVRDNVLQMRRQKTDMPVEIPVLPELRAAQAAMPKADHLTFLTTEYGKPFSAAGFGNWFRDRCDEAGLPQCSAHGLRKAAATRLADNGATDHELMAWFGWKSISQAQTYTKAANRKRLAASAARLISGTGIGKPEIQFAKTEAK